MKKKTLLLLLLLLPLLLLPVRAEGYTLALNSPTTAVGNEFLLRVNLKDGAWQNVAAGSLALRLGYNSDELEFIGAYGGLGNPYTHTGSGEVVIRDQGDSAVYSLRLRFKALKACSSSVKLLEAIVKDAEGNPVSFELVNGVVTVLESSDDAGLYALSVTPGQLNPRFSTDITHYSMQVNKDTEGIQVTAKPNGYFATAYVEGHWGLKEGHNYITIDMTSGGGCSALYTIDVFKEGDIPLEAEPTAEAAPIPTPEPSPTPAPEPTPEPTLAPIIRDSEETLRALRQANDEKTLALDSAAAHAKIAKIAVVIALAELVVIVLQGIFIWKRLFSSDEEYDEEYEEYEESEESEADREEEKEGAEEAEEAEETDTTEEQEEAVEPEEVSHESE